MLQHNVFQALDRKKQYKYPFLFLGLFLTFLLSTVTLANRIVDFHGMLLPGGIFVFPLTFSICDIVGEVYGYAYPRLFIWIGVLAELIFSLVGIAVSHLGAPEFFAQAPAWQTVYDPTLRYVGAGLTGLLVGEMANVYLLSKLKIFFRGKYFIVRSLVSTAVVAGLADPGGRCSELSWENVGRSSGHDDALWLSVEARLCGFNGLPGLADGSVPQES